MNKNLQKIFDIFQKTENLSTEEKDSVVKALKDTDKELEISTFKLERTEKVKKTTAILLEETIEELEQKRKAVEDQNRELEIEGSLERVRAVAMSMNKSDDLLSICEISFKEFKKLGFDNLRNTMINILNDVKRFFMDYDFSDYLGGSINKISYNSHPIVENYLKQIKKADDAFAEVVIEGNQLDGWKEFRLKGGQLDDPRLDEISSLHYYLYSIGVGDIGISTFKPINESQIKILKRFRNVFDLAYRRYNDIAQAEAQAREAQIEAALERVRSKTMAMHNSQDVGDTVIVLFDEVLKLGLDKSIRCGIGILEGKEKMETWSATSYTNGEVDLKMGMLDMTIHPMLIGLKEAWKSSESGYSYEYIGDDVIRYYNALNNEPEYPFFVELDTLPEKEYHNSFFFSEGILFAFTVNPISEEAAKVLNRFANVFEQTYTRFLDLQKAEAQAREAQIETALERVRSRTMAMQKSEELKVVIQVVYEQFIQLNILIEHTGFIMDYKARDDMNIWLADRHGAGALSQVTIPYFDCAHWNSFNEAKEKGIDFFANLLNFEEKNRFYRDLFKLIPELPEEAKEYYFSCPGLAISTVLLENVGLYIENFSGTPYSDEENNTLMRFGKVFQQTYTRFNDLQKAEAQAREAQIETALERVRSRTMAMYDSNELLEAVAVFFQQFKSLDLLPSEARTYFCHINTDNHTAKVWMTHTDGKVMQGSHITPLNKSPSMLKYYEAWKSKEPLNIRNYSGEALADYMQFLLTLPHVSMDEGYQHLFKDPPERIVMTDANFLNGNIGVMTFEPLSQDALDTLVRFAKVFELTYTRFLDLQKAEAQAREAKIEAALEKVRSRTMAMQRSEELSETSFVLFQQFAELGIVPNRFFIGIVNEEEGIFDLWITEWGGTMSSQTFKGNLEEPLMWKKVYEAWKAHQKSIVVDIHGEDLVKWNDYLKSIGFSVANRKLVSRIVNSCAIFSKGILSITTPEITETETVQLLERFASVFDGTYTRFIDLKKAEEQAREAQIEAALERVRAIAMSMMKSEDLMNVSKILLTELNTLGFESIRNTQIDILNDDKGSFLNYLYSDYGVSGVTEVFYNSHPIVEQFVKDVHSASDALSSLKITGPDLDEWRAHRKQAKHLPDTKLDEAESLYYYSYSIGTGALGVSTFEPIGEEKLEILKRFRNVFNLTYRRYTDIAQAEAQAREAQIEAALERVRAKAMAMHKSDDLSLAVATIFDELDKLKLGMLRCGIGILNKEKRTADVWTTTISEQGKTVQVSGDESMDIHPLLQGAFNAWLEQTDFSLVLEGEELKNYYKALLGVNFKLPDSESKISKTEGLKQYYYVTSFQAGGLFAFRETDFPDESKMVMKRFADVFNLTYTRFQDLQHAEAQAKEAKIETALERVRSRTMAMQRSDELAETAAIVFKQLIGLGIAPNRLYIGIIKDNSGEVEFWITDEDGTKVSQRFMGNVARNLSMQKIYDGWKSKKKSIIIDMQGDELKAYFRYLSDELHVPFKQGLSQKRRVQNIAYFSQGFIGIASPESQPEETSDLLKRFAAVFHLTYTRFNDLQKSEAQNVLIQAENERKTKELEEARLLQLAMLPKELPQLPNLDIAVYMQTATEVGGDYYDFQVGLDGTLITIIGDATGHGMKAGTVVTITKSLFNSMAANENILDAFDKISQVIKGMKFRQLAMCLLMMKIKGNRLSISSAAMPPALIYRANDKTVEEIFLKGMPLGTMNKFPYKKIETHLHSGDRILLYSDGLPELANDKDQMFGYDKIITEFQSVGEKEPEEIVNHLKNSASQWVNGKDPDDDVTFVVIKVK